MPAKSVEIAAALVTRLNEATFSQPVQAARDYSPARALPDLASTQAVKATVVMTARADAPAGRKVRENEYTLQVGIQKRAEPTDAGFDPLVLLTEEVADHLVDYPALAGTGGRVVRAEVLAVYLPDDADELRTFSSVIEVAVRVLRGQP